MPNVPTYNSNIQEQAAPNIRVGANAPVEAFGGGEAAKNPYAGILELGTKYAEQEKQKFDQINVQDYDTSASKLAIDLQAKASKFKGKDAADVTNFIDTEWQKGKSDLDQMLNNDAQRAAGQRLANNHYEFLYKFGVTYSAAETSKYDLDSTNSALDNSQNVASKNFMNPATIAGEIEKQKALIEDYGRRNGLTGSEQLKEIESKNLSKTHTSVLTEMSDSGNYLMAKEYLKTFNDEIYVDDRPKVEKMVREGSVLGESQRNLDSYVGQGFDYEKSLEQLDKIKDPVIRKGTRSEIENHFAAVEKAKKQQNDKRVQDSTNIIIQSSGQEMPPISALSGMPAEDVTKLMNLRDRLNKGPEIKPGGLEYQKYLAMSESEEARPIFLATNLSLELTGKVSSSELESLLKSQAKLQGKDSDSSTFLDYLDSNEKIKREAFKSAGLLNNTSFWKPWTWFDTADQARLVETNNAVNQAKSQKESAIGRKLEPDEMREVVNKVLTNQIVTNRTAPNTQTITVDQIPINTRGQIEGLYQRNGVKLTNEKLIQSYLDGQRKGFWK